VRNPFTGSQYTVEVFAGQHEGWFWRIRHQNGEILATSEGYSSAAKASQTAERIARAAGFKLAPL
jgi:uncharacterized protein YegP (UPF0339 family)